MYIHRKLVAFILVLTFSILATQALGQDLSKTEKALQLITRTSDDVCYKIQREGKGSSFEVQGMAKAEVSKLIKKLADIGVNANLTIAEYEGVLQKDLLSAIQSQSQCAERIFNKLVERLVPLSPQGAIQYKSDQSTQVDGLDISLQGCQKAGAKITCSLIFINQQAPRIVYFDNARCCTAHDQRGNSSTAATAAIANASRAMKMHGLKMLGAELISGVATPVELSFSDFPPGVEVISSLRIEMLLGKSRSEFRFLNIPIDK